jgi:hypothetical protein
MKKNDKKIIYSEPADYFPKELRKKHKIGEYAENTEKKTETKKKVKRK